MTDGARRDHDGKLTMLSLAPECGLGGHEAEVRRYITRDRGDGQRVRVGFACTCGGVTIDGVLAGVSHG